MQAIILAAGMGKRLKNLTKNNTKCMIEVNGIPLIYRMLHQLDKYNLSKIIIVDGYEKKHLEEYVASINIKTPITFIENPIYDKTNNIYSLWLAKEHLIAEDTILLESDLIFDETILDILINDPHHTLALVDKYESWMDGTCVKLSSDGTISEFIPKKYFDYRDINEYYKTVNIYKFSKRFSKNYYIPFLDAYKTAKGENEYYEQVLRIIASLESPKIDVIKLDGQLWYEIDDIQDLDIASSMFVSDEEVRVKLLNQRYGGYWRYPKLLDYCYLVNPFFPPQKMLEEIKSSFDVLIRQYPSGMKVNSLLAAKNFNINQENIVIGNGAAELIRCIMQNTTGSIGVIRPTFEEYCNSYSNGEVIAFWPNNENFSYTVTDIISYFSDKNINSLIVINPDNPSGNYIPKDEAIQLIEWCDQRSITLIWDESFIDFSDISNDALMSQEIIDRFKNLFIIKSISKSYGVPGLRLGVLVSGNESAVSTIKNNIPIWNINSFAEFYMQISEKYSNDYANSLIEFRKERAVFTEELSSIPGIRVIPSQANYIMAEITNGTSAKELNRRLIVNHNIIIKNLVAKMHENGKQYIRLAIKAHEDNIKLVEAIRREIG